MYLLILVISNITQS